MKLQFLCNETNTITLNAFSQNPTASFFPINMATVGENKHAITYDVFLFVEFFVLSFILSLNIPIN